MIFSQKIPSSFRIRMAFDEFTGCYFLYMSRETNTGNLSTIKWSYFESLTVLEEIEKFLLSYERHPQTGVEALELLDYFHGKAADRAYANEAKNWEEYWKDADLALENVKLRFVHRRASNSYTLLLHQPVRSAQARNYQWGGPIFYINMAGMRTLVAYLRHAHNEAMYDPPSEK